MYLPKLSDDKVPKPFKIFSLTPPLYSNLYSLSILIKFTSILCPVIFSFESKIPLILYIEFGNLINPSPVILLSIKLAK